MSIDYPIASLLICGVTAKLIPRRIQRTATEICKFTTKHAHVQTDGQTIRKDDEWPDENKMERRVPSRLEKYWTESGKGGGHGVERSSVIPATLCDM